MDDTVEIQYDEQLRETDAAILFEIGGEEVWIPKSLIEDQDGAIIEVPRWFAAKENLMGERA